MIRTEQNAKNLKQTGKYIVEKKGEWNWIEKIEQIDQIVL